MAGVNIGVGAVIGAGSIVTKNVGNYEVVAGRPARVIKKRFSDDIITKMLEIKWWEWEHNIIKERFNDLMDIHSFIQKYSIK
jgi:serine acetyltransferase